MIALDEMLTDTIVLHHHLKNKNKKFYLHSQTIKKKFIFNIQLRNRIKETIQLLKPDKFSLLAGFEGGFQFMRIKNIQI